MGERVNLLVDMRSLRDELNDLFREYSSVGNISVRLFFALIYLGIKRTDVHDVNALIVKMNYMDTETAESFTSHVSIILRGFFKEICDSIGCTPDELYFYRLPAMQDTIDFLVFCDYIGYKSTRGNKPFPDYFYPII